MPPPGRDSEVTDALRQEYAVKEKKPRPLWIEEVQDDIHLYSFSISSSFWLSPISLDLPSTS